MELIGRHRLHLRSVRCGFVIVPMVVSGYIAVVVCIYRGRGGGSDVAGTVMMASVCLACRPAGVMKSSWC
jgi:hypothetical protein